MNPSDYYQLFTLLYDSRDDFPSWVPNWALNLDITLLGIGTFTSYTMLEHTLLL
jgi:hypothetical protein